MSNHCLAYRVDVIYIGNVDAEHCALRQKRIEQQQTIELVGTSETVEWHKNRSALTGIDK